MIDHNAIFQLVYQKGFLSKREIGELFRHRTEHIQLRFRVEIVQQKRCKKAEIAIAPNANAISPRMRNRIKAGNRMATNADELRKRGHLERRRHQPIRLKHHIILQKTIVSAGAEKTRAQIILCNDIIRLCGGIGDRNHPIAHLKGAGWVIDDFGNTFMDERHRQLRLQGGL